MDAIAIVGAGLIGRSWAIVFTRAGRQVRLYDAVEGAAEQARAQIGQGLRELAAYGLADDPEGALARVSISFGLEEAVESVGLVQENLPEDRDLKAHVFASLDRVAPADALLASSTSAIPVSAFTEGLEGRGRCLVAHPVNPPHLVPLVELCGAPWTTPDTIERAKRLYEAVDQVPIVVKREIEGFILNRLQGALLTEAFRLVKDGYVSPEDLDKTVKDGLGLRWSFMGPFETIELNAPEGIPDYWRRYAPFYRRLASAPPGAAAWEEDALARVMEEREATPQARLPARQAWRDRRLTALIAHKREAARRITEDREGD